MSVLRVRSWQGLICVPPREVCAAEGVQCRTARADRIALERRDESVHHTTVPRDAAGAPERKMCVGQEWIVPVSDERRERV